LKLGLLRRSSWSEEEDKILIERYPEVGTDCFKLIPTRTFSACCNRVRTLSIKITDGLSGTEWSNAEDNIIKTNYPTEGGAISNRLPNRSPGSIKHHARVLKVKYLGPKRRTGQKRVRCIETSIIYDSARAAAKAMNISYKTIQANASGIKKSGGGYHWEYVDNE
jgi:hypothetical protein